MAIYHLQAKTHSRGVGKGAGGHVRYITRQGPYSEKTVEQADGSAITKTRVSRADEVLYIESGNMPDWAHDPADYWDAADQYERANGTVYREIEFALPMELSDMANIALAQDFAKRLAKVPDGVTPYTLAIHRSEKDPALLHCHLMLSDKINDGITRDPGLWFKRAAASPKNKNPVDPAKGGAKKTQARISHEWLGEVVRPLWTELANQSLDRAGFESVRIDHRTLDAQMKEAEQQAEQARASGDLVAYKKATDKAASLDHPPQPKRGRVMEHAPEKAPRQVAKIIEFDLAKDARQAARAEMDRMEAEVESARQAINMEKAAEAQQAKALETAAIMGKWMQAHPLQAKAQRLFRGKLPWMTPDGLPRKALKNPDTWTAADAWLAGSRHKDNEQAPTTDNAKSAQQFGYAAEIMRRETAEIDRKIAQRERKAATFGLRKRVAKIQKSAEEQGHRAVVTGMSPDQITADAAYRQLVADVDGDADFAELARAAYQDGKARAISEASKKLDRYTVAIVETKTEITTITATPDPDPAPAQEPDQTWTGHRRP